MIKFINNTGSMTLSLSEDEIVAAMEQFQEQNFLLVRHFFSPQYAGALSQILQRLPFTPQKYPQGTQGNEVVKELINTGQHFERLRFLLENEDHLEQLRLITQEPLLGTFAGRFSKLQSESGQSFPWHSDLSLGKKIALSVNLSQGLFNGGELFIRDRRNGKEVMIHNTGLGDAVLFPIHDNFEHRVSEVHGPNHRTVLTGWYC